MPAVHLLKKIKNSKTIYKNDFDKAYFQHDMAYGQYKDMTEKAQSDKVLRDKDWKNTIR